MTFELLCAIPRLDMYGITVGRRPTDGGGVLPGILCGYDDRGGALVVVIGPPCPKGLLIGMSLSL